MGSVNAVRRTAIAANHSATHLLHAALRQAMGNTVEQKGSLVEGGRLRLDFACANPLSPQALNRIEQLVNAQIRLNTEVTTELLSRDEASRRGAMALFGEKYGEYVRVLTIGQGFSSELCGRTHVKRTGDIGYFKIIRESGISAGIRRIEAVTGEEAVLWGQAIEAQVDRLATLLKTAPEGLEQKMQQLILEKKQADKIFDEVQQGLFEGEKKRIPDAIVSIQGIQVLALCFSYAGPKPLRRLLEKLKGELKTAVIVLAGIEGQKSHILCGVTQDCIAAFSAIEIADYVALQVGGKGGGRPDMAQATGQTEGLSQAVQSVYDWVKERA